MDQRCRCYLRNDGITFTITKNCLSL